MFQVWMAVDALAMTEALEKLSEALASGRWAATGTNYGYEAKLIDAATEQALSV
jgi:hypothetical protein